MGNGGNKGREFIGSLKSSNKLDSMKGGELLVVYNKVKKKDDRNGRGNPHNNEYKLLTRELALEPINEDNQQDILKLMNLVKDCKEDRKNKRASHEQEVEAEEWVEKYQIGRFYKKENDNYKIFIESNEIEIILVPAKDEDKENLEIMLIDEQTIGDAFQTTKGIKQMIEDDFDKFFLKLNDKVNEIVQLVIHEKYNISPNLLNRIKTHQIHFFDYFQLLDINKKFVEIERNIQEILVQVKHHVGPEIDYFLNNLKYLKIFHPDRENTLNSLSSNSFVILAKSRIQQFIGISSYALQEINIEYQQCFSGNKKLQLAEWWMDLIRNRVKQLLEDNSYNFTAVNENYIDSPPEDLPAVRFNLNLIKKILNPSNDEFKIVQRLIEPLKLEIYPKLDEFKQKLVIILLSQSFCVSKNVEEFKLETYKSLLESSFAAQAIDKAKYDRLRAICKDIEYLDDMKQLEANFLNSPGAGNKLALTDVVPISGLVMNYFHRMEMELKTVLEIWEGQSNQQQKPPTLTLQPQIESHSTPSSPSPYGNDNEPHNICRLSHSAQDGARISASLTLKGRPRRGERESSLFFSKPPKEKMTSPRDPNGEDRFHPPPPASIENDEEDSEDTNISLSFSDSFELEES